MSKETTDLAWPTCARCGKYQPNCTCNQTTDNPEQKSFEAWLKSLIERAFGFPRRIEEDGMIIEGPES